MPPPDSLTRRWRKLKKRCSSFSTSDRLVRSKSFTEQDVQPDTDTTDSAEADAAAAAAAAAVDENLYNPATVVGGKYLTVGARDAGKFQGIRERIAQWNTDLKKRRSTENLAGGGDGKRLDPDPDSSAMFVLASPQQGYIRSALVISSAGKGGGGGDCATIERQPPKYQSATAARHSATWVSPSPSPPVSDNSTSSSADFQLDPSQRHDSGPHSSSSPYYSSSYLYHHHSHHHNDQDSGYDCGSGPEKSIYSTGSSDTSSVLSSEPDSSLNSSPYTETYSKGRPPRPRPSPIYEKHEDFRGTQPPAPCPLSLSPSDARRSLPPATNSRTLSPRRSRISKANVINLVNNRQRKARGNSAGDGGADDSGCHSSSSSSSSVSPPSESPPPPPLPPRPVNYLGCETPPNGRPLQLRSLPPLPSSIGSKPRSSLIQHGAVSLPRKRIDFEAKARRRGSYHHPQEKRLEVGEVGSRLEKEGEAEQGQENSMGKLEHDKQASDSLRFCTLPRQRKSTNYTIKTISFHKGPGHKSLGFTVVGGKDSPKGSIGIYVKSVFANGQAMGVLKEGDEIFSVNGQTVAGLTHQETIAMFKQVKQGTIQVTMGRKEQKNVLKISENHLV